ncbi:hypothetical protein R3P38DRAFT_3472596 [Favolaschia claudopus]|uniref:Uncharacterized protein n=1 Tax=Favolaschia claudopus TaxID=2862362 RepID=A0AAV9ZBJ4_9AGAR
MSLLPLPSMLLLLAASALAQDSIGNNEGKPHIDGGAGLKGRDNGRILVIIALLAVAIYAVDQYLYRRRLRAPPTKTPPSTYGYGKFTRIPTEDDDDKSYRYLIPLPPAAATLSISPTKANANAKKDYGNGPFYPVTPLSAGSTVVPTSPFYPGSLPPSTPKSFVAPRSMTEDRPDEASSAGSQTLYFEPYSLYLSGPASPNSLPPGAMSPQSAASFRSTQSVASLSGGVSVRSARSEPQRR